MMMIDYYYYFSAVLIILFSNLLPILDGCILLYNIPFFFYFMCACSFGNNVTLTLMLLKILELNWVRVTCLNLFLHFHLIPSFCYFLHLCTSCPCLSSSLGWCKCVCVSHSACWDFAVMSRSGLWVAPLSLLCFVTVITSNNGLYSCFRFHNVQSQP